MAPDEAGPGRLLPAVDLVVVVGGAVGLVSAGGLAWSYLRVGAVRPTYVREAQFLAALVLLLVWTVRNRRGRGRGVSPRDERRAAPSESPPRRFGLYRRLPGGARATATDVPGTDAYLLVTGVVLLVLSLGVELLGVPAG